MQFFDCKKKLFDDIWPFYKLHSFFYLSQSISSAPITEEFNTLLMITTSFLPIPNQNSYILSRNVHESHYHLTATGHVKVRWNGWIMFRMAQGKVIRDTCNETSFAPLPNVAWRLFNLSNPRTIQFLSDNEDGRGITLTEFVFCAENVP